MMTLNDLLNKKDDSVEIYFSDPLSDDYTKYKFGDEYCQQFDDCRVEWFEIDYNKKRIIVSIIVPTLIKTFDSEHGMDFVKLEDW